MDDTNTKVVLWQNVLALMQKAYGREHLTKLAAEAEIGPGTASRIKACQTSVGVDVVERIAHLFGVETWRLLAPGLGHGSEYVGKLSDLTVARPPDAPYPASEPNVGPGVSEDAMQSKDLFWEVWSDLDDAAKERLWGGIVQASREKRERIDRARRALETSAEGYSGKNVVKRA